MDAWIGIDAFGEIEYNDEIKLVVGCWCKRKRKMFKINEKITLISQNIIDEGKVVKEVVACQVQIV